LSVLQSLPSLPALADVARTARPSGDDSYVVDNDALIRLGDGSPARGRARLRLLLADERERKPISGPVIKPASVRLATIRDEPAILDLLLADLAENASKVATPSISQIMRQVEPGTRQQGAFVPVIDGDDAKPVAVAILHPQKWWWSDTIYLSETVMYVAPEARKGHAGRDLLQYECWLSDQMSAEIGQRIFVLAGVTATRRGRTKLRLYSRHMNPVGGFLIYPAIDGMTL
jgi:hypothetical protein